MSPAKPSPTPNTQIANLRFVVYGHDWRLVPSPGLSFPRDLDWVVSRGPSSPKSQGANSSVTPSLAPPPPQSRIALDPGRRVRCGASPLRVLTARRGHALPRRSCFWVVTDVSTGTRTGGSSSLRSSRGDTRRPRGGQSSWEMSPSCSPGRLPPACSGCSHRGCGVSFRRDSGKSENILPRSRPRSPGSLSRVDKRGTGSDP